MADFSFFLDNVNVALFSLILGAILGKSRKVGSEYLSGKYWLTYSLLILTSILIVSYFQEKLDFLSTAFLSTFTLYFAFRKPLSNTRKSISNLTGKFFK